MADRDRCAAEAVALLREAIDSGYKDLSPRRSMRDLLRWRDRDDFKKLLN